MFKALQNIILCVILASIMWAYIALKEENSRLKLQLRYTSIELKYYQEIDEQECLLAKEFGIRNPKRSLEIAKEIRNYYIKFITEHYLVHPRMSNSQKYEVSATIYDESLKRGIHPVISGKVCFVESSGDPLAYNTKSGAKGLFQTLDATTRDFAYHAGAMDKGWAKTTEEIHRVAFDPIKSAKIGIYYLAYQKKKTRYWIEAYNGGMRAAILASRGLLPRNHESYLYKIKVEGRIPYIVKTNVKPVGKFTPVG